ncbi:hypothetical protein LBMAG56_01730 [Verrucomicrobiota bacterium]|nr:hypothetical protein LBMAG56_01730 [Verrucomicrobiota bacterium]
MARNPELEALLQAKFDLDTADEEHKTAGERNYFARLDGIIARAAIPGMTRETIERSLLDPYREFKRAKLQEQRAKPARLR